MNDRTAITLIVLLVWAGIALLIYGVAVGEPLCSLVGGFIAGHWGRMAWSWWRCGP